MSFNIKEIYEACNKSNISEYDTLKILANLPKKRSSLENRSLHKLFKHISDELNELGRTFQYVGIKGLDLECKYTPEIVKNCIWKPLQDALIEKSSTTQLTNADEKLIFNVLEKWFAEQGVNIVWVAKTEEYKQYLESKEKK